jgi:hypothetical protein
MIKNRALVVLVKIGVHRAITAELARVEAKKNFKMPSIWYEAPSTAATNNPPSMGHSWDR